MRYGRHGGPGKRSLGSSPLRAVTPVFLLLVTLTAVTPRVSAAQSWSPEPVLEIGDALDPDYSLTAVRGMLVDEEGRVYLGQPEDGVIRVYSSDGRFLRAIGSRGRGPGEIQSLSAFGLLGDSLWISDLSQDRVTWFSLSGGLLRARSWNLKLGEGDTRRAVPQEILREGHAVAAPTLTFGRRRIPEEYAALPVYLVTPDGTVDRELFSVAARKRALLMAFDRGRVVSSFQPLRDTPMVESLPGGRGLVEVHRPAAGSGDTARFRVVIRGVRGDSTGGWFVDYRPVPVSEELRDRYVARAAEKATRIPNGPPEGRAREVAREALYLPKFHPPVSELVVGRAGRLWLQREMTGRKKRWEAYSRSGRLLGEARLDEELRLLAGIGDTLWAARRSEVGVPKVVKLVIER